MAELADALDLGSSVPRRAGSSPVFRTNSINVGIHAIMGAFFGSQNLMPFDYLLTTIEKINGF